MTAQLALLPMPQREVIARAIYGKYPFCLAESMGVMTRGFAVSRCCDWDAAPAFHKQECYELADAIMAAMLIAQHDEAAAVCAAARA